MRGVGEGVGESRWGRDGKMGPAAVGKRGRVGGGVGTTGRAQRNGQSRDLRERRSKQMAGRRRPGSSPEEGEKRRAHQAADTLFLPDQAVPASEAGEPAAEARGVALTEAGVRTTVPDGVMVPLTRP